MITDPVAFQQSHKDTSWLVGFSTMSKGTSRLVGFSITSKGHFMTCWLFQEALYGLVVLRGIPW
jgi:hypothetical protein